MTDQPFDLRCSSPLGKVRALNAESLARHLRLSAPDLHHCNVATGFGNLPWQALSKSPSNSTTWIRLF